MPSQDKQEDVHLEFWQHLDELRGRIIRCLIALILGTIVVWSFCEPVVLFLEQPLLKLLPAGENHLYFTGITDKFFIYLKVSILIGTGLTSPYLLLQLWLFVAPAMYRKEKRMVLPLVTFGSLSFVAGLAFAYFIVLPYSYDFLIHFGSSTDKPIITLTAYFSLTLKLMLALGLIFELPVVMIILALMGIAEASTLTKYRGYALVAIAVSAACITPTPDAITMLMVMVPLWLLYEISIIGVRIVNRRSRSEEEETEDPTPA